MKKGVSLLIVVVAITVMSILITASIILGASAIKTAQYEEFLSQINRVSNSVNEYVLENTSLPTTGEIIAGNSLGEVFMAELSQNGDENDKLHVINVDLLSDGTIKKGKGTTINKDLFLVAEKTNNIYYMNGFKYKGKIYFGLKLENSEGSSKSVTEVLGYVTNGIVLHWDAINNNGFEHSDTTTVWKDLSGNGNDGKLYNFLFTGGNTSGWTDSSLHFNGNNYVEAINKASTSFTSSNFTISITMKLNSSYSGNGPCVLGTGQWQNSGFYVQLRGNDQISINTNQSGGSQAIYSPYNTTTSGSTKNVVFVRNGANMKLYVDGVFSNEISNVINLKISQYPFMINMNKNSINMDVMSVKVYNTNLSASEVSQNYLIDKTRYGV